jgi:hypothetical protein
MSPVPAAALSQSKNCHPEAAEPRAKASDSQRRISVLRSDTIMSGAGEIPKSKSPTRARITYPFEELQNPPLDNLARNSYHAEEKKKK